MSFFGRIKDIFSASVNDMLDAAEDPEKMANEYLRQLNDQYYKIKTQVATAMADEDRLQRKLVEAQSEVEKYHTMAETSLRAGKEDLARRALQRKAQAQKLATQYQAQFQVQSEQVDQLQDALANIETKMGETKARRDLIIAKKNRAKTQESLLATVQKVGRASVSDKLDRLEDQVDDQLAKADAMAKLETGTLDNQFRELEMQSGVDSEMEEMKRKLGVA